MLSTELLLKVYWMLNVGDNEEETASELLISTRATDNFGTTK